MYIALFSIAILARWSYWLQDRTRINPSSEVFLGICRGLSTSPLEAHHTILAQGSGGYWYFFSGYWVPMCGIHSVSGPDAVVIAQILLSSGTVLLVADTARRYLDVRTAIVAGLPMSALADTFAWTTRLLSDTAFTFAVVAAVWQLTRYDERPTNRNRFLVYAALGYLAVVKVQGLPIVLAYLAWDLLPDRYDLSYGLYPYQRAALVIAALAVPLVAIIAVPAWVNYVSHHLYSGTVVQFDDTFRYAYTPRGTGSEFRFVAQNLDHLFVLFVLKVTFLWLPVIDRFSLLHNAVNVVTLAPTIGLGWTGLVLAARERPALARTAGTPLVVLTLLVGATFVDFSWGYRAPMTPPLVVLGSYALHRAAREVRVRMLSTGTT
ncbi:glycosyltransferase family 39 protein [Halosimplex rubrum]|uniref:Glycosyltransferase family 39 protein n=1 Tax=Halosimplex rubrum TaxID=869889 RepID=A0A7D5P3U6_9EURY|nr:glycosyltransferase family 39 protein [Halosimplex rubrum]QLH76842.1 glycosyltransferase family 39 protein [Halosimplex rubrum]